MTLIVYEMQIVGGPFDGTPGMSWADEGGMPPAPVILLGRCPGDRSCHRRGECRRQGHPYYWVPGESGCPAVRHVYELQRSFVERHRPADEGQYPGRAIYVISGLLLPEPDDGRELVGAGVSGSLDTHSNEGGTGDGD